MNTTARSFLIWLITNFTGSIIATALKLHEAMIPHENLDTFTVFWLYFVLGSFLSLPAILFTYFNLQYISEKNLSPRQKYRYLIISVPVLLIIGIFLLTLPSNNIHNFKWNEILNIYEMVSAHIISATIFTVVLAKGLIEPKPADDAQLSENTNHEAVIHKL